MLPNSQPLFAASLALALLPFTQAELLLGYGRTDLDAVCAQACRSAVPTQLDCPEFAEMTPEERAEAYPSYDCFANDDNYLASIAWCIKNTCPDLELYKIIKYWDEDLLYGEAQPKYSYLDSVALVDLAAQLTPFGMNDTVLNRTVAIEHDTWVSYWNALVSYSKVTEFGSLYSILIFVTGVTVPFGFTVLSMLPFPAKWMSMFNAYFIDPPLFGKRHSVPVLGLAMIPTRGQALFIMLLIFVNTLGSFHGYPRMVPNAWYPDRGDELTRHIANRVGALCFANIPLVFLYGGRNSLLLWFTNWSHGTFLLIHRWIGFICTVQACLHSAMWLHMIIGYGSYPVVIKLPYWIWGIVGTMSLTLLIPFSVLPLRKHYYEIFLIGHIFLAIMGMVGAWYHIVKLYDHTGGYDIWLYLGMGIWGLDRVMRWVRVAKRGVKRAYVTRVDEEYIRVDVPGVDCHGYCYAYFPTLSWRVWENHPFSVVGSNPGHTPEHPPSPTSHSESEGPSTAPRLQLDVAGKEKSGFRTKTRSIAVANRNSGITLFIRPHKGLTKLLATKCGVAGGIPVLIESSYGHEGKTFLQGDESKFKPTPEYPNVLCIAGGVGITAVLPALNQTLSLYGPMGTTKLYWGIRQRGLVEAIEGILVGKAEDEYGAWGHIEPHITVGSRINCRQVLEDELAESTEGTTVVVCGPVAMCDEVRYTVAALARHGKTLRFIEESVPW